ncbi:Ala-tRNA(Pro) deacylase [Lachnospiraceae bacterium PF1-21]|uniref:prolyl-tRNA synthetase associated domain-containing protein n=1 Tax=Ohessyouella blattaphilus TaxID=2949333 RepID=UPI003E2BE358
MIHVSEVKTTAPEVYNNELQEKVFQALAELEIPFERVDTDEVITMEDCENVNERLDMQMVKTLFLCDRKQQDFYLFVTKGNKPFRAKDFSNVLEVPRVSFAPAEMMEEMLGTKIGAATIFSALLEGAKEVRIVVDKAVANMEWYGCSDSTTTGYMKVKTEQILQKFLPFTGRRAETIRV